MHFNETNKILLSGFIGMVMLFMSPLLKAQSTLVISLEEAQSKAINKNTSLKISQQDYAVAKAQYERTNAVLLPQIRLSNTSTLTNNPLYAFGYKLLQREVNTVDFDPNSLNNPGDVENFNTRIELVQPIINVDGWKERKTANLNLEAKNLQADRTNEMIELEVTKTYLQLQLAHKSLEVIEKAKETAIQNRIWAKNNLDQGLIQDAAYLNMEVRVAEVENKLQLARSNVQNVSDYLAFLIGEESKFTFKPNTELLLTDLTFDQQAGLNQDRKDIKAMKISVDAQEQMLQSSKMSFVPRANAVANYEWNDDTVFGFGANNYMVGLQLSWDIFSGYKNIGKIHQEKAMMEKASLSQQKYIAESELELNKAKRQFTDAANNVKVSNLAMDQSKEVLRMTTNRFNEGLEQSKDLLHAETQFQEKELEYVQAIFNYNVSLAYLKFLTR
jgi:outer membrane protein TolC